MPRGLAISNVLNTKNRKVGNKNPDDAKYITSPEFTKFVTKRFNKKSKKENLPTNSDVSAVLQRADKNKEKIEKYKRLT